MMTNGSESNGLQKDDALYWKLLGNKNNKGEETHARRSRNFLSVDSCLQEFLNESFVGSKEYTRDKCRWSLTRTKNHLIAGNFDPHPKHVTREAVEYLLYVAWKDKCVSYQKSEISYLKRFLKFYDNLVIQKMGLHFPEDMRINVHWLSKDQYKALLAVPKTPLQQMVIHLELRLGLRNAECCRLLLSEIDPYAGVAGVVTVRGKGRGNGKYRTVRFHENTKMVLKAWLEERQKIVEKVREHNPNWRDPGTLLLWCHYKNRPQAGPYNEHTGSLDDMVLDPLRKTLGFHFCNHDLRRTFGRRLFHAKTPIETIARFLGHSSINETIKYLGLNLDDMDEGMAKLAEYDEKEGCNNANI